MIHYKCRAAFVSALALVCALVIGANRSSAALIINVGSDTVQQGKTATFSISVTDDGSASAEDIEGMNFTLQLGDGTGTPPTISNLDVLTGTIWSGHVSPSNVSTPEGGSDPQFQSRFLLTDNGGDFVTANGTLATFTINAAGALPGDYDLRLVQTSESGSDTTLLNGTGDAVPATINNGTLHVTPAPEPSLAAFGLIGCAMARSRRLSRGMQKRL